ncbi:aldo/keto reductase [Arthrobacter sp. MMS24-S77]
MVAIADVCDRHSVPLPAAAIQYPLRHPAVATVCVGARNAEQVTRNAELFDVQIPAVLWEELVTEASSALPLRSAQPDRADLQPTAGTDGGGRFPGSSGDRNRRAPSRAVSALNAVATRYGYPLQIDAAGVPPPGPSDSDHGAVAHLRNARPRRRPIRARRASRSTTRLGTFPEEKEVPVGPTQAAA